MNKIFLGLCEDDNYGSPSDSSYYYLVIAENLTRAENLAKKIKMDGVLTHGKMGYGDFEGYIEIGQTMMKEKVFLLIEITRELLAVNLKLKISKNNYENLLCNKINVINEYNNKIFFGIKKIKAKYCWSEKINDNLRIYGDTTQFCLVIAKDIIEAEKLCNTKFDQYIIMGITKKERIWIFNIYNGEPYESIIHFLNNQIYRKLHS